MAPRPNARHRSSAAMHPPQCGPPIPPFRVCATRRAFPAPAVGRSRTGTDAVRSGERMYAASHLHPRRLGRALCSQLLVYPRDLVQLPPEALHDLPRAPSRHAASTGASGAEMQRTGGRAAQWHTIVASNISALPPEAATSCTEVPSTAVGGWPPLPLGVLDEARAPSPSRRCESEKCSCPLPIWAQGSDAGRGMGARVTAPRLGGLHARTCRRKSAISWRSWATSRLPASSVPASLKGRGVSPGLASSRIRDTEKDGDAILRQCVALGAA